MYARHTLVSSEEPLPSSVSGSRASATSLAYGDRWQGLICKDLAVF